VTVDVGPWRPVDVNLRAGATVWAKHPHAAHAGWLFVRVLHRSWGVANAVTNGPGFDI
jgi:hypothetical protein